MTTVHKNFYNKLLSEYKPCIGREVNVIHSDISKELIFRSYKNEESIPFVKPSICESAYLLNGKNSIKTIKSKCHINTEEVFNLISWLKKNNFLEQKMPAKEHTYVGLNKTSKVRVNNWVSEKKTIIFLGATKINLSLIKALEKVKKVRIKIYQPKNILCEIFDSNVKKLLINESQLEQNIKQCDLVIGGFSENSRDINLHINTLIHTHNKDWLFYEFISDDYLISVGPLINKTSKTCYWCYSERVNENKYFEKKNYIKKASVHYPPILLEEIVDIATTNILYVLSKEKDKLENKVHTVYLNKKTRKNELLIPKIDCEYCGAGYCDNNIPIQLKKRMAVSSENGLRSVPLKSTYLKSLRLISRIGIVTKLLIKPDGGINAISANPLYLKPKEGIPRKRSGKGVVYMQKINSVVAETVERYSAEIIPPENIIINTFNNVKTHAIDPRLFYLPNFQFLEKKPIKWIWVRSLYDQKKYLVPFASLNLVGSDSNGLAAGNNIEEAILQGLLELVERDVWMIMDLNSLYMSDVDMAGLEKGKFKEMFSYFKINQIKYSIKCITNDIKIPSFGVYIENKLNASYSVGTHLNKEIALSRAITEAIQAYGLSKEMKKRDISHYFKPSPSSINFKDIKSFDSKNILENINECKRLLKDKAELFVYDFSQPHTGFNVVRILATNLQPVWCDHHKRFSNRLFDVPQTLGYKRKSKKELNYGFIVGYPCYRYRPV